MQPGEEIRKRKRRKLLAGILTIVTGILLATVEMYLPFLEVKGFLAVFVAVPLVWIGSGMCFRATHVQPADILNLAEEMNEQITPQAVIKAFDCKPTEAEQCLQKMLSLNLIQLAQEGIDNGEYLYTTTMSANPDAEVSARSHELDELLCKASLVRSDGTASTGRSDSAKQ